MAERDKGFKDLSWRVAKPVLKGVPAGLVMGGVSLVGITWRNHRELTHKSVKTHPLLATLIEAEQRSIGMPTSVWASVHRIHHEFADASLYPFYRIARVINWLEENPDKKDDVRIHEAFKHLDPFVSEFAREQVVEIGNLAEQEIKKRLGDNFAPYEPDLSSLEEEIVELFHPTDPLYFYPDYGKHVGDYSQEQIAQILLTDPHSPVLTPPHEGHLNGVREVFKNNVSLYKRAGNMFKARPELRPQDLQEKNDTDRNAVAEVITGFVVLSGLNSLWRGAKSPEDHIIAAAQASAANGVKMAVGIYGGNATNSIGHAGALLVKDIWRVVTKKDYNIKLNDDGSVSTDTAKAGFPGKLISWSTLDEVGGQDVHHRYPGKINYTNKTGRSAWFEAPWGSFTAFLARNNLFGIEPGDGFPDGERRPDMPHEGLQIIQALRAEQLREVNEGRVDLL